MRLALVLALAMPLAAYGICECPPYDVTHFKVAWQRASYGNDDTLVALLSATAICPDQGEFGKFCAVQAVLTYYGLDLVGWAQPSLSEQYPCYWLQCDFPNDSNLDGLNHDGYGWALDDGDAYFMLQADPTCNCPPEGCSQQNPPLEPTAPYGSEMPLAWLYFKVVDGPGTYILTVLDGFGLYSTTAILPSCAPGFNTYCDQCDDASASVEVTDGGDSVPTLAELDATVVGMLECPK